VTGSLLEGFAAARAFLTRGKFRKPIL